MHRVRLAGGGRVEAVELLEGELRRAEEEQCKAGAAYSNSRSVYFETMEEVQTRVATKAHKSAKRKSGLSFLIHNSHDVHDGIPGSAANDYWHTQKTLNGAILVLLERKIPRRTGGESITRFPPAAISIYRR